MLEATSLLHSSLFDTTPIAIGIPDVAKQDILNVEVNGTRLYTNFVENRLQTSSKLTVWDPMKLSRFKTMSTWMKKTKVRVGNKVVKLQEERQLLSRLMIIQQTRKIDMRSVIGMYEMGVIPRSLFSNEGSLLIPTNKSSFIHYIEAQIVPITVNHVEDNDDLVDNLETYMNNRVVIIHAMAIVQQIKKTQAMKKMSDH